MDASRSSNRSDNIVDVSTTLREHPGESIIRLSHPVKGIMRCNILDTFSMTVGHKSLNLLYICELCHWEKLDAFGPLVFITPGLTRSTIIIKGLIQIVIMAMYLGRCGDRLFGTSQIAI